MKPDLFDAWTDHPDKRRWLEALCTPHPIGCFRHGATLSGRQKEIAERHYIICDRNFPSPFHAEFQRIKLLKGWTVHHINAKHDAMVECPEELAEIFHEISETEAK